MSTIESLNSVFIVSLLGDSHLLCTSWWGAPPPGTIAAPRNRNIPRCEWPSEPGRQPRPSPAERPNFGVTVVTKAGHSWRRFKYLGAAGGRPHAGACSLHQSPLVSRQQVVLHGLNQVIFTCATVLNQGLFLHPLTQSDRKTPLCFHLFTHKSFHPLFLIFSLLEF